jgi:YHS domain-containing protein
MKTYLTLSVVMVMAAGMWGAGAVNADDANRATAGDAYPLLTDPVGDSLVNVDKPAVLVYQGRELHFVNEANVEKFNADPGKYLDEVDKMIVAQQTPLYPLDTCVVSGEKLGDMQKPVDYVYGNRLVRFCCPKCVSVFNSDPAKYLAKIDAAVIAKQKADYKPTECPVSGEKLGGDMGDPQYFVIGNRLVEFCCPMCKKEFVKNPAKYLAKLDAAEKAN